MTAPIGFSGTTSLQGGGSDATSRNGDSVFTSGFDSSGWTVATGKASASAPLSTTTIMLGLIAVVVAWKLAK